MWSGIREAGGSQEGIWEVWWGYSRGDRSVCDQETNNVEKMVKKSCRGGIVDWSLVHPCPWKRYFEVLVFGVKESEKSSILGSEIFAVIISTGVKMSSYWSKVKPSSHTTRILLNKKGQQDDWAPCTQKHTEGSHACDDRGRDWVFQLWAKLWMPMTAGNHQKLPKGAWSITSTLSAVSGPSTSFQSSVLRWPPHLANKHNQWDTNKHNQWDTDTHYNIDEPWKFLAKWKKQVEKPTCSTMTLTHFIGTVTEQANPETGSRTVVVSGEEEGAGRANANSFGVFGGAWWSILELDRRNNCTTLGAHEELHTFKREF